ncbi:SDR family NAD(P)-dependent oxidoreductase [Actinokineospora xionganensis]|uniref:SDR family NAD(P)-dependent oxidoreductase n=1 Tax=Actinokineospora xionganensis TaxID=2684470 RepID=A0ABR7L245_9PSEU|nr:SDR family NAD(P)-dependent oxidoreductase [Actinokineospora xionganensis]MBC6446758.1 SDR family NAD(P)-dependent oxidoreductase [Actinokineospora xionganensis]
MTVTSASQTALVTGGSAGVGLALAKRLAADGVKVTICGRDKDRLDDAARWIPGLRTVVADLAIEAGVRAVADAAPDRLDLLINNAAVQLDRDWQATPTEDLLADIDAELGADLLAPMRLTALLLPRLAPEAVIVNVSSALGTVPKRSTPGYCAAKAGLSALSTSLRYQLAPRRVVEAVLPLVDTGMTAGRGRSKISPDAAAEAILRGMRRDVVRIGGVRALLAVNRVAPSLAARLIRES